MLLSTTTHNLLLCKTYWLEYMVSMTVHLATKATRVMGTTEEANTDLTS
jgi:hypothetical protein